MAINLRRIGEVVDGSITTVKLADGAVTGLKTAGNLKTSYLVADDTTVSYTGTVYNNEKEMRFVIKQADIPSGEIIVKAEAMASVGTTDIGVFFNSEISPRIELSTVGTGFELLEGTAYIGDLGNGVHSINLSLRNLDGGVAYNKLIEGNRRWVNETLKSKASYFEEMSKGQSPEYLWIGCSDSLSIQRNLHMDKNQTRRSPHVCRQYTEHHSRYNSVL